MKKTKAGMGGMKPHSKECPMSPEAGRGGEGFFSKVSGGSMALPNLDFRPSSAVRIHISVVLSLRVYVYLLRQPGKLIWGWGADYLVIV